MRSMLQPNFVGNRCQRLLGIRVERTEPTISVTLVNAGGPLPVGWVLETGPGALAGPLGNVALAYVLGNRMITAAAAAE